MDCRPGARDPAERANGTGEGRPVPCKAQSFAIGSNKVQENFSRGVTSLSR